MDGVATFSASMITDCSVAMASSVAIATKSGSAMVFGAAGARAGTTAQTASEITAGATQNPGI